MLLALLALCLSLNEAAIIPSNIVGHYDAPPHVELQSVTLPTTLKFCNLIPTGYLGYVQIQGVKSEYVRYNNCTEVTGLLTGYNIEIKLYRALSLNSNGTHQSTEYLLALDDAPVYNLVIASGNWQIISPQGFGPIDVGFTRVINYHSYDHPPLNPLAQTRYSEFEVDWGLGAGWEAVGNLTYGTFSFFDQVIGRGSWLVRVVPTSSNLTTDTDAILAQNTMNVDRLNTNGLVVLCALTGSTTDPVNFPVKVYYAGPVNAASRSASACSLLFVILALRWLSII
jgi:hypothetical protein